MEVDYNEKKQILVIKDSQGNYTRFDGDEIAELKAALPSVEKKAEPKKKAKKKMFA